MKPRGWIVELDGLRGVAVAMVILHHSWYGARVGPLATSLEIVAKFGWAGVDLFFALSGFLITQILLRTRTHEGYYRSFYARRCLRILPLFFLVVGTTVVAAPLLEATSWFPDLGIQDRGPSWLYLLFLVLFWVAAQGFTWLPLDITWSLAIEEQFYVVWAPVVRKLDLKKLGQVLLLVLLWSPVIRLGTILLTAHLDAATYVPAYVLTPCRLDALGYGAGVALLLAQGRQALLERLLPLGAGLGALLVLLVATESFGRPNTRVATVGFALMPAVTAAVIAAMVLGRWRAVAAVLRWSPLRALGKVSFAAYLVHPAIERVLRLGIPGRREVIESGALGPAVQHTLMVFACTIVVAGASWLLLERRLLPFKSRFVTTPPATA